MKSMVYSGWKNKVGTADRACKCGSWKNHWIVLESLKVRHAIQVYRSAGKVHKQIQLDTLSSGSTNKDWPFGFLWCTETLNSNEKIVNGEAYNEIKNVDIEFEQEFFKSTVTNNKTVEEYEPTKILNKRELRRRLKGRL